MADLLQTLILPRSPTSHANSSQDSFHSFEGDAPPSLRPEAAVNNPHTQLSEAPNLADASVHNGIQVYGIDAYLADPSNADLLSKEHAHIQPVPLGIQTSQYVSRLYEACQAKCLTPIFEIEGQPEKAIFNGVLKIGDTIITLNEQCRSKKEARERLAEKGVEAVKGMESRKGGVPAAGVEQVKEGKEPNWIGLLQDYHNQEHGPVQSPIYTLYALGTSFACTVLLPSLPTSPFGLPTTPYPNKKQARSAAAAEAIRFLVSEGKLNPDGSTLPRKKSTIINNNNSGGSARSVKLQAEGNVLAVDTGATFAQRVNDISPMLGLNAPQYVLRAVDGDAPNILSGWAMFAGGGEALQRVGEVRNVFGKRSAREEVAKGVWEVLVRLAGERGVGLGKGGI